MQAYKKPTKESVRKWMQDRARADVPPPTIDRIRADLGWLASQQKRVLS